MKVKVATSRIFTAIVASALTVVSTNDELRALRTDDEFLKKLPTTPYDAPEYELGRTIHDPHRRSSEKLRPQFGAFDNDCDIHLDPSDGFLAGVETPVWLASTRPDGTVRYKKFSSNIVGSVAKNFVPASYPASSVVDGTNDEPRFQGTVHDPIGASSPDGLRRVKKKKLKVSKRGIAGLSRRLIPVEHRVFIESQESSNDSVALGKQVDEFVGRFNEADVQGTRRFANDTVYPSILIVTDYWRTPKTQDESRFHKAIRYQLAFWNTVDLYYRNLESPKVRLRIAGIVIGQGRSATPYINKFSSYDEFNAYQTLPEMGNYWRKQASNPDFKSDAFHVIITLTDASMVDDHGTPIRGIANERALCKSSKDYFGAVGIINDNRKFIGIPTAVHELSHIFGASHDPHGAARGPCSARLRNIMSPLPSRRRAGHHWSRCSLNEMKQFLAQDGACANRPSEIHRPGSPIERISPGDVFTNEQQCIFHNFPYACPPEPKMCKKLQCASRALEGPEPKDLCTDGPVGALAGTPCAPGATCVSGECRRGDQIVR